MRGLAAYLIKNYPQLSDDEIKLEVVKWKGLFFPKQMIQRYIEETQTGQYTPDIAALLPEIDDEKLKEMKQAAKAEPFFAKCVELDPKHGESYFHWSQALGAAKKYQQSLDAALKAKELCGPELQSNIEFLIKAAKSRLK